MNCFEWQNHSADFLDGALPEAARAEADHHLAECPDCSLRYKHYRAILASIGSQPRATLPIPVRKAPLTGSLPRPELRARMSRWQRFPWYVRTSFEALGIVCTALVIVAMVPRLRALYETSMERRLNALIGNEVGFDSSSAPADTAAAAVPLAGGNLTEDSAGDEAVGNYEGESANASGATDDDADEILPASSDAPATGKDIVVGNGEIWRFNLKTDSPRDLRTRVVHILTHLKLPSSTPGFGGVEAPGGIQFSLLVRKDLVPPLMEELKKLSASISPEIEPNPTAPRNLDFTWYKTRSRTPIPHGYTRAVIWLYQM